MEKLRLSPPWITFVHEVEALFAQDEEVKVKYDDEFCTLKLYVDNTDKAEALSQILPEKKEFGNITVTIEVVPANLKEAPIDKLFEKAFSGNLALSYTTAFDSPFGKVSYVVFEKKVIQFFNDQMDDINGNKSMLYEDAARDVFGTELGIFYCTDASGNLAKPLGEWP